MIQPYEKGFQLESVGDNIEIAVWTDKEGTIKTKNVYGWKEAIVFIGQELELTFSIIEHLDWPSNRVS